MVLSNTLDIDPRTLRGDLMQASNSMRCRTGKWHVVYFYGRHLRLLYHILLLILF